MPTCVPCPDHWLLGATPHTFAGYGSCWLEGPHEGPHEGPQPLHSVPYALYTGGQCCFHTVKSRVFCPPTTTRQHAPKPLTQAPDPRSPPTPYPRCFAAASVPLTPPPAPARSGPPSAPPESPAPAPRWCPGPPCPHATRCACPRARRGNHPRPRHPSPLRMAPAVCG